MDMTLESYINNPLGKKNSVISHREMYRAMYAEKLDKLYLRENGNINFTVYKYKKGYYIHFKIPSESAEEVYYDTVFQFFAPSVEQELESDIRNYNVKFFSNDPSFVFTFAYAFLQKDLFIPDLKSKLSKYTKNTPAYERNPDNQVNYVKSFYFAYLIMLNKNMFLKVRLDAVAENYSSSKLNNEVMHADEKIEQVNQGKKDKKKPKKAPELPPDNISNKETHTQISKQSKYVTKTRTTNKIGKTKTVSKVKRI